MMKKSAALLAVIIGVFAFGTALAADGASLYASKCKMCHGAAGEGAAMGPKLAGSDLIKGDGEAIKAIIVKGVAAADKKYPNFPMGMPGSKISDAELDALVAHLKSL